MPPTIVARAAYAAFYSAMGASVPYLAVYYGSRGLSLDTIGLLGSVAAAVGLVASPLWGTVADRFPRSRLVLPAAGVVAAAGATALALVDGPLLIVASVIGMAVGIAGVQPILDARALEAVRGDRNRYGGLRAWGSASFIVVVWLTGVVVERTGSSSLFLLYVPTLLATAAIALVLRGGGGTPALPRLTGIGVVLRQPAVARFLAAVLLVWSAAMAITWFFTVQLLAIGTPGELVGGAWALGALVEIPIMWAYPALAARVGTERLLVLGAAAFALRALAITLVRDPVLATLSMGIHGVGFSLVLVGGVTHVSRHAPPAVAATAQGVLSATVFSLAIMIGPGIGGLLAGAWGLQAMFAFATVASAIGIGAMWLAVRPSAKEAPAVTVAVSAEQR